MNIHRHRWKECLKIRKLTKFKGDTSKGNEDISPKSREILKTFVWWGHELAPIIQTSVQFCDLKELHLRFFQQITFKLGIFFTSFLV